MPNIVTHAYITAASFEGGSPNLLLGSTLPDFIGMYNSYYKGSMKVGEVQTPPELRDGVRFHLRTDAVFDAQPDRKALLAEGRADCAANIPDLPARSARSVANMSTDILMDVAVLDTVLGEQTYQHLKTEVLAGRTALHEVFDDQFADLVRQFFETDRVLLYTDMEWLVGMMNHRFSLRKVKDVSFERRLMPKVAEMLERQLSRIRAVGTNLLSRTIDDLRTLTD